jgi:uncharacterized protein (TIGR02271 family)
MTEQEQFSTKNNPDNQSLKLEVIHEHLNVDKELVETGRVLVKKKVHEVNETVDTSVKSENVQVERIAVNKYVDTYPDIRYQGETMIVPVVKEVMVVVKKLLLVEEVHVTKQISVKEDHQTMPVRHEEIIIERTNNQHTQV